MADPLGLIGPQPGGVPPVQPQRGREQDARPQDGPGFKDVLMENLRQVNELQQDATTAIEDLQAGRRDDLETVLMATEKADTAFRMLLAARNKVLDAYNEIKQISV